MSEQKTTGFWYYVKIVGGGLLLALASNAIWDSFGKMTFWYGVDLGIRVMSKVSYTIINYPYSKAPLDPASVAVVYFIFFLVLSTVFVIVSGRTSDMRDKFDSAILILLSALSLMFFAGFGTHGIAVDINRDFQSNLHALAPYLSDDEEEDLLAKYNTIRTREEMLEIRSKMKRIASEARIELRD